MYTKRFDEWNDVKKQINARKNLPYIHEGSVWYCSVGVNVGCEIDGKHERHERPVIVFRKFDEEFFWGIPLTSGEHSSGYFYPLFLKATHRLSFAVLPQMKLIDRHRMLRKVCMIATVDLMLLQLHIADLAINKRPLLSQGPQEQTWLSQDANVN